MVRRGLLKDNAASLLFCVRLLDVVLWIIAGLLAFWVKFGHLQLNVSYRLIILFGALLVPIVFSCFKVYDPLRGRQFYKHVKRIFFSLVVVMMCLMMLVFSLKIGANFSRIWMFYCAIIASTLLVAFRCCLNFFLKTLRKHGFNQRRIVVIGAGNIGEKVSQAVNDALWSGLCIHMFMDDASDYQRKNVNDIPIITVPKDLDYYLKQNCIDEVWIALPLTAMNRVAEISHKLRFSTVTVRLVPDIFTFNLLNHSVTEIAGVPVVSIKTSPMIGINRWVKAIEDRMLALMVLILISPLLLIIAIVVKLSSSGPVFYRQRRVSWNGVEFDMLKFRSMPVNVEAKTGAVWAQAGENRATKVGSFLRRTSLDELPQFINVLRGDMSIVGPRPERPVFVEQFKQEIPRYMQKHLVKAGITGWAQINGWRGNTDLSKRIEHDLYYIENWSLWFDLKIIFATFVNGFVNKNAY
ncbi:MAG: undecaprenyl-phosphate glucose phosphotransferase [Gammaproteobacteria bacterium]